MSDDPPDDRRNSDQAILRRISSRVDKVETAMEQLPLLKAAIDVVDGRMRTLAQRDEELSASLRQLSETHIRAFESFNRQAEQNREALDQQENRWRSALDRVEAQHRESNERIAQETVAQISRMAFRGTFGWIAERAWTVAITLAIAGIGWSFHFIFFR